MNRLFRHYRAHLLILAGILSTAWGGSIALMTPTTSGHLLIGILLIGAGIICLGLPMLVNSIFRTK